MQQQISDNKTSKGYLYQLFALCFSSGLFGATVSTLLSEYLPEIEKELTGTSIGENAERAGAIINSMFLFGWMFGGILWGVICDRFGRKKAVIYSTACYGIFSLMTAVAPSWEYLIAFRFLSGFGVGGVIVTTTILISEAWTPAKRAIAIGLLTICFPVGVFLAGAIVAFIPDWREAFFIGIVPLIISFISFYVLKEPDEWKKNIDEQTQGQKFSQLFIPENRNNIFIGSITFGAMLIGLWAIFAWLPTWIQTLITEGDGQKERGLAMMSLAGAALLGGCFSGWFTSFAGWRKTMLLCFAVCFLVSFILFKLTTTYSSIIFIEIGLLGFFFGVSQGVLSDFISKIFPPVIRASATGFCFNAGRLFTASVVFFVGWLVTAFGSYGNSIFIFSFVFLIGLGATFFVKENPLTD